MEELGLNQPHIPRCGPETACPNCSAADCNAEIGHLLGNYPHRQLFPPSAAGYLHQASQQQSLSVSDNNNHNGHSEYASYPTTVPDGTGQGHPFYSPTDLDSYSAPSLTSSALWTSSPLQSTTIPGIPKYDFGDGHYQQYLQPQQLQTQQLQTVDMGMQALQPNNSTSVSIPIRQSNSSAGPNAGDGSYSTGQFGVDYMSGWTEANDGWDNAGVWNPSLPTAQDTAFHPNSTESQSLGFANSWDTSAMMTSPSGANANNSFDHAYPTSLPSQDFGQGLAFSNHPQTNYGYLSRNVTPLGQLFDSSSENVAYDMASRDPSIDLTSSQPFGSSDQDFLDSLPSELSFKTDVDTTSHQESAVCPSPDVQTTEKSDNDNYAELNSVLRSSRSKGASKARETRDAAARSKTRKVREIRACLTCRTLKMECSDGGPCERCIKAILRCNGAPALAHRLCSRDIENAKNARQKISDFFEMRYRDIPTSTCSKCPPKVHVINLIHPPEAIGDGFYLYQSAPLKIEIEECLSGADVLKLFGVSVSSVAPTSTPATLLEKSKEILEQRFRTDLEAKLGPDQTTASFHSLNCLLQKTSQNYRIRLESLPTAEALIKWGSRDILEKAALSPNNIEAVLDAILVCYLKISSSAPLSALVQHIISITILSRYLDGRRPIDEEKFLYFRGKGIDDRMFRASGMPERVRNQLFKCAVEAIEKLEEITLAVIDDLLPPERRTKNDNIADPLILGLCVRRLSLYYRRIMIRYKQFGEEQETKRKNGQDMYETMIRHYARAFKGTASPFHNDWDATDHKEALLGDDGLIARFEQFKIAEIHHAQHELDPTDDIVYRAMFSEKCHKNWASPSKGLRSRNSSRGSAAPKRADRVKKSTRNAVTKAFSEGL